MGFSVHDGKHKVFQRTANSPSMTFDTEHEAFRGYVARSGRGKALPATAASKDTIAIDSAMRGLLQQYAPPSMLVNNHNEVVHLFGNVKPYFQAREGSASLEVSRVLPESVVPIASALMFKSAKDQQRMVSDMIRVRACSDGERRMVRLSVRPVLQQGDESLMLLSFEEHRDTEEGEVPEPINVDAETMARVDVLERELTATRESLQATIEELETSNEELQATNEELMASNEELQSSNEELQSVNEELNTVNAEYQEKVGILNKVNADLDSMAKAVGVATVFVDDDLNLTRYSPDAVGIFKIRETDVGRPLDEITNTLRYPGLMEDLQTTMRTERMVQKEVAGEDGILFLVRLLPYRVSNNRRGAVATFVDITAFRDRQRMQMILDALPEHIAVLEHDGTIAMINRAWRSFAKANGDPDLAHSGIGSNYLDACRVEGVAPDTDAESAYRGIKAVLEGSETGFSFEYPCHSPSEQRWFVMNVAPIQGDEFGGVVSHVNVSAWYKPKD
jgi:two-component system CheB/CheR fusion protein